MFDREGEFIWGGSGFWCVIEGVIQFEGGENRDIVYRERGGAIVFVEDKGGVDKRVGEVVIEKCFFFICFMELTKIKHLLTGAF